MLSSAALAQAPKGTSNPTGSRLIVMAGGGIREENVRSVVSLSGVREVHVRLTRLAHGGEVPTRRALHIRKSLPEDEATWEETDEQRVSAICRETQRVGR